MEWTDPLSVVSGIGPLRQKLLEAQGIFTVKDLLTYIPYHYEDSTNILSISGLYKEFLALPVWELPTEKYAIRAVLVKKSAFRSKRGFYIIKATFTEPVGGEISFTAEPKTIDAVWFNQEFLLPQLHEGSEFLLFGKVEKEGSKLLFQSPKIELVAPGLLGKTIGKVVPIYRRIKTIRSAHIRNWVRTILSQFTISEPFPEAILGKRKLRPLGESLQNVHVPIVSTDPDIGYRRLAMQELVELKLRFDETKVQEESNFAGKDLAARLASYIGVAVKNLPFALTPSQSQILDRLLQTIASGKRIDSFVYGDVGSGKTIIVLLLAAALIKEGKSTMIGVPTSILASQHAKTAETLGIRTVVVTAKQKLKKVEDEPAVYIGTHALLSSPIRNDDSVAFVVIDEQHRFGVLQREALAGNKGRHVVMLSATPIPRTLALSFLGFSDSLAITHRPVGRKEIITKVVPFGKDVATYEWIARHVESGEQAYIVFPRIEDENETEKQSLLSMAELLKRAYFADISTALVYGALKEEEKFSIMQDFRAGRTKILFSTSVIEVGVDVPNATIMAIHGAEMFGLAQLHQLRGRVGRSDQQGFCFLFSAAQQDEQLARLQYFSEQQSGLAVAEYDLKHRGTGQILGIDQAGISELRIASLDNLELVQEAMEVYEEVKKQNKPFITYLLSS